MNRQLLKSMVIVLVAVAMLINVCSLAFAEEQYVTEDSDVNCEIVYEQASTYTIILPKKIVLGTNKTAEYSVSVTGDIASDQQLSIIPDSTTMMSDVSGGTKDDVEATIEQDKITWTWRDVSSSISGTGTVSAKDLSAGAWSGTFKFAIELETLSQQE